jgi:aspartyl-tRNA(Asn)/glutamyl-tRNA(Gln) amidotransferase subunit C
MSPVIDEDRVRHIAKLGRLALSADEVQVFARQLADILSYVKQLEEVDTEGVEPLAHALPIANVLREDEPHVPLDAETALANAPAREATFFKVPPILDPGGGGA